jgi:hypothetical protein
MCNWCSCYGRCSRDTDVFGRRVLGKRRESETHISQIVSIYHCVSGERFVSFRPFRKMQRAADISCLPVHYAGRVGCVLFLADIMVSGLTTA